MADTAKLEIPRIRVTYADQSTIDVQTENPDMVFYDMERAKRKWPTGQDAPMLWINYLAYSKLKRSGKTAAKTFDEWLLTTTTIENLNENGNASADVVTADPTHAVAESD